jgi:hypothetical protein
MTELEIGDYVHCGALLWINKITNEPVFARSSGYYVASPDDTLETEICAELKTGRVRAPPSPCVTSVDASVLFTCVPRTICFTYRGVTCGRHLTTNIPILVVCDHSVVGGDIVAERGARFLVLATSTWLGGTCRGFEVVSHVDESSDKKIEDQVRYFKMQLQFDGL